MSTVNALFILLVLVSVVRSVHHRYELDELQTNIFRNGFHTVATSPNENAKENITIGFLTSFREGVGKIISGAIPLAVEFVNKWVKSFRFSKTSKRRLENLNLSFFLSCLKQIPTQP